MTAWAFHRLPDPVAALEAAYQGRLFEIMAQGGRGLNPALEVRGEGPETRSGWHRLLLVTPWTALRVYVPEDPGDPTGLPAADDLEMEADGTITVGAELTLPFGEEAPSVEVAFDPRVGHHLVETLAVDMAAFDDTGEALAWARERAAGRDAGDDTAVVPRRRLSRRGLLKGLLGRG